MGIVCSVRQFGDRSDEEVRERSWKDDLGSPWSGWQDGRRLLPRGAPQEVEGNHRPMQENFEGKNDPMSHMLWGSVVKGGLKMPLTFTSKEAYQGPRKNDCWKWGEVETLFNINVDKSDYRCLFADYELESIASSQRAAVVEKSFDFFFLKKKMSRVGGV